MLKLFLSSTFNDLEEERKVLNDKISPSLNMVRMETFIPDGRKSQPIAIGALKECNVIIFLISPYYGSLISPSSCLIDQCNVKNCSHGDISYTHCEYRYAVAEEKPRMVYLVTPESQKPEVIQRCVDNSTRYESLKKEIYSNEMAPSIKTIITSQYNRITSDLASNIVRWYDEGKIELDGFYCRAKELKQLMEIIDKANERVLVHGLGGIGKTTLVQVVLLLQSLKGKKVFSIGTRQSYLTGSGYSYFLSSNLIHKVTQQDNTISLMDLANLFDIQEYKRMNKNELIEALLECLRNQDYLTFIDDFHLADSDVKTLITQVNTGIILASKEDMVYGRRRFKICGVEQDMRVEIVRSIAKRLAISVDKESEKVIANISDGHPVIMEILVNNYQIVDYKDIQKALSVEKVIENEFLERAVKSILSTNTFEIFQQLAILNPDLDTNLDVEAIQETYPEKNIDELLRKGLIQKREGDSSRYCIPFQSIRQITSINFIDEISCHSKALVYYENKAKHNGKKDLSDQVEIVFHLVQLLKLSKTKSSGYSATQRREN